MLQLCQIYACANGTLGLNLSRAPWDPYPWVSGVAQDSNAQRAGIRMGDTVLELNGCDVLGMKISELALHLREHWQSGAEYVSMVVWRNKAAQSDASTSSSAASSSSTDVSEYDAADGINQQSLQKFATCLQHIAQLLECPVCLEVIKPPGWQCCNGHVLCNTCRSRSEKCPVCRVPLGPRGRCLLSDKLFTLLAESFPCDGVKTTNSNNSNNNNKSNNLNKRCANISEPTSKCTTEYHNHPKMAFSGAKLFEAKEMLKKTKYARQTNKLDEATLVDVDDVGTKISNTKAQMPMGNAQQQQQQQARQGQHEHQGQVNGRASSAAEGNMKKKGGLENSANQREVNKSNFLNCAQFSDCNKQTSAVATTTTTTASGSNNTNSNNNNNNNNSNNNSDKNEDNDNLLVKPKLKSSKKSSQITGQDQDELHNDEVANINNGMPTTRVTTTTTTAVATAAKQQQYQNYHCPTGKSCCSYVQTFLNAGQSEFDGFRDANKLSTSSNEENAKRTTTTATIQDVDNNIAEAQQQNVSVAKSSQVEAKAEAEAATAVSLAKSTNDVSLSCMTQAWRPRNRCDTGRPCSRGMQQGRHNCSCVANKATAIKAPAENQQHQQQQQQQLELQQKGKLIVLTAKEAQAEQSIKAYNKLPTPKTRLQFGFHDEWQLLQHLSVSHRLAVMHFYGTYGERLHVPCCLPARRQSTIACLNLRAQRRTSDGAVHTVGQVQRFFLAVIALSDNAAGSAVTTVATKATEATEKYAIFLWQITNGNENGNANEGNNFETIIAPRRTAIKWFGCAQPLTKSWNEIRNTGHFLTHHVLPGIDDDDDDDEAFEIVVKMKNH